MMDQELLLELTESYLKSLISRVADSLDCAFDSFTPFREIGIESFHVLKIIKALEADFGTLPKTLLFENFNINDLAKYFINKHAEILSAKFAVKAHPAAVAQQPEPVKLIAKTTVKQISPDVPVKQAVAVPPRVPVRMLEMRVGARAEWKELIQGLFDRYKNDSSVSRGTRNIAPNLFIGGERRGYFNYSRSKNIILAYSYTGPLDYFPSLAGELYQYCAEKNFQLNILADIQIESVGGVPFSATPFGVVQRVLNLRDFTLEGGAMRRLRYQVSKFEKAGTCRTTEYRCGSDPATDRSIAAIIDSWCSVRAMVNPLVHIAKEEILAGTLSAQHRLFLTYVNDVLQNVILISPMSSEQNGYLMDLEFYPPDMPLGGLEFAIARIIEVLKAEGSGMLSLGATLGPKLAPSANADPDVDRILNDLREQNIFNDEGNLQFKNKFRPENKTIFLCRPVGSGDADNVIDIIMMIADPSRLQTSDEENHNFEAATSREMVSPAEPPVRAVSRAAHPVATESVPPQAVQAEQGAYGAATIEGEKRSQILSKFGYNPLNITDEHVEFDLKTDSWAQLTTPAIDKQMLHLHAQLQQPANLDENLRAIFPFKYFALATSGRAAEQVFCRAWPRKGVVPQNLLFPTTIFHQIDKGFTPREMPHPAVLRPASGEPYKGDIDFESLEKQIAQDSASIAYVCIEVANNAAGGQPVSLRHLRQVKDLLAGHSIPLVIDATRILENARFLLEHEPEFSGKTLWDAAREISACADAVVASLPKDFCVNQGGVIATNDLGLFNRLQDLIHEDGSGLDVIDRKLIALSLKNRKQIEAQVLRRMESARLIWDALNKHGVPVVQPAGGHCVLIDVKQIPEFKGFAYPVASFLAWLYLSTGIRAGAHSVGMQKNSPINNLVRLAIPIGLRREQAEEIAGRLKRLFESKENIPEIVGESRGAEAALDVHASYRLIKFHKVAVRAVSAHHTATSAPESFQNPHGAARVPAGKTADSASTERAPAPAERPRLPSDIAIVGMAGRYPKATNPGELWENLLQGRDCIGDIPDSRFARRWGRESAAKYRGGFIDDVDKFDSLFFNISPREAEMLDPQERLFLEVAWETIEDAGYYPEILAGESAPRNIGVFVGAVWAMYQMIGVEEKAAGNKINPNSFLWSVANRVSYWMNLSGPSLTLDTACSSSLTAIYLACEAIYKGECTAAIAGGVNLDLHQSKHDINWAGGTLSKDGLCRSFGQGANGYVEGEGIGAVFLKPLDQALRDNDHIYGVIKSVVVNHGGRTSGYAVPNPKAQARLILSALERAQIDARSIGYIEAHGTGTELGDPVEIAGLSEAFQGYPVQHQSCAVGSVKSNIGHLEAAAGVVGLSKVLLQMKHRRLVPSLHSSQLNEFIDFRSSPFYVPQQVEEWKAREVDGVRFPLRAGISSFGAGGSNAHIILESYEPAGQSTEPDTQPGERIFPLSARNEDQLRETAVRLREFIRRDLACQDPALRNSLDNISNTLRIGRKSFDHRLAIIAESKGELVELLDRFIDGKTDEKILTGNIKDTQGITRLLNRREKEEFIHLLSQRRDPRRMAQLWIDGLLGDWRGFPVQGAGRRISLPTYPFADKRHWASEGPRRTGLALLPRQGMHPLIDSNESTFERQLFKKTFNLKEFFIHDHLVSDIPTLPGVAYLELARKAGELAAGRKVQKIRNILWVSPLTVRNSVPNEAFIDLKPAGDTVQFEVFSQDANGKKQVYSQGKLSYATIHESEAAPEFIDLESVRARCSKVIDGKDAYPLFKSLGLNLGPSFQVLQEVLKNENEILGLLKIPQVRSGDFEDFVLHPSLVDGSFQAGMGAQLGDKVGEMFVPYSIGEVEILHPLQPVCYSYVTDARGDKKASSRLAKSNVFILDETGKILVKIRESVGVPLIDVHQKPASADAEGFSRLYYSQVWEQSALDAEKIRHSAPDPVLLFARDEELRDLYRERLRAAGKGSENVVLVRPGTGFEDFGGQSYTVNPESPQDYVRLLQVLDRQQRLPEKICFAWPVVSHQGEDNNPDSCTADFLRQSLATGVFALLCLCQSLIEKKTQGKIQLLYVHPGSPVGPQPQHEAINGFARTLQLEHPKLSCKSLEIRQQTFAAAAVLDAILAEFHADTQDAATVRYEEQERQVRKLREFKLDENPETAALLKEQGVYLITGGAGGLGLIFAEFLARQYKARLVLTGRSALSAEREARLEEFRKLGAEVFYVAADVSDREDAARVVAAARERFGALDGVIHSAGVLRDSYIRNKKPEDMQAVFAPKLYGTLHLDELTQRDNIDFFVTFSSLAAVGGNAGQCDYSFANHFMDSFAARRELLRQKGERSGKTLSLNWSLWADGGMKIDEQTEIFFRKNLGIKPLSSATGLDAFARGLSSEKTQFAVVEGVQEKIERAWGLRKEEAPAPTLAPAAAGAQSSPVAAEADGDVCNLVQNQLAQIVVEFLKLDPEDIDPDKILLDLGFDSIGLTGYANAINDRYKLDITPVLFFEYPSIREIAKHLATEQKSAVLQYHRPGGTATPAAAAPAHSAEQTAAAANPQGAFGINKGWNPGVAKQASEGRVYGGLAPERRFVDMPVAIVGMSGVMPQSDDLDEFWDNLKNARNMITEIPKDRWNWEEYFGDPLKEENKSNSKWGGFMKEVDKFDPLFFGISPREAELMDPQQRIFLETVWKAIEDSGHKVSDLSGTKTGLFVGVATRDYVDLLTYHRVPVHAYTSTGNSHSVLVNRISFLLNLHGPSAPLDTACSSSLIALHRALESIHTGSCEMAIVGGVQVMTSPAGYIAFGQAGMLSDDGKCKTFDKRANGYVRGEGSGAIFIKPLSKAIADGNHIYALIKATAENHGGSAAALTAPNPNAQSELLIEAYDKAHIDPATVGYIECHGTGTSLGDPIEIQALKKTFSELYRKHSKSAPAAPHCGLSSVKTNIGHLETGAGIAGILKVLLAIKHRQIPASLHFEEINPYIDLKGSPFYVVDKTIPWEAPKAADGTLLPRRAGVSSFGFGGANAHVVLEEYVAAEEYSSVQVQGPHLIVLSAKNKDRLKAYARSLLVRLEADAPALADLAYTLQVGRDAMADRLALVAEDATDLKRKLAGFIDDQSGVGHLYHNNIRSKKGKSQPDAKAGDVQACIERKDLAKLAELWVAGAEIKWSALYPAGLPRRISLPTYPFARDHYWIPVPEAALAEEQDREAQGSAAARLHSLVHRNVSTLREQKFATRLSGQEFYLADHVVETQMILPGVAYMEMARAAGELSGEANVRFIRNLVWLRPIIIAGDAKDVEISLTPGRTEVEFAVKSVAREHRVTHCTGRLAYAGTVAEPEVLDVVAIRRRCPEEVLSGKDLYPFLSGLGLHLGKSFQIVQAIYANEAESLAVLQLPEHLKKDAGRFWLHPALMDGSLHTAVGLMKKNRMRVPLSLPFAVGEVQILHPLTDLYYGYATWAVDHPMADQSVLKVNIELLDKSGKVLVRIKDFSSKPLHPGAFNVTPREPATQAKEHVVTQYYQNAWKELEITPRKEDAPVPGHFLVFDRTELIRNSLEERLTGLAGKPQVMLVKMGPVYRESGDNFYQINPERPEDYRQLFDSLARRGLLPENILHRWSEKDFTAGEEALQSSLQKGVYSLLYLSQALMQALKERDQAPANGQTRPRKTRLLYIYSSDEEQAEPHHAAAGAFARSIAAENSRFVYKTVEFQGLAARLTPDEMLDRVFAELREESGADVEVRYRARRRSVRLVEELNLAPCTGSGLKEKGVYLITGGAGGLGLRFAKYLAVQVRARLALTGRSSLGPEQRDQIRELQSLGAEVEYYEADVSSRQDLERLIARVKSRFNTLDGIIHSAGVARDAAIPTKTAAEMEAVFAAKIYGTLNLDEATREERLDFFALFSSVTAVTGNAGQSDYAYANSFMDHFAELRDQYRANGQRYGSTVSFNWPLWREGGMRIDPQLEAFFETMGIHALGTATGLDAFEKGLTSGRTRMIVMHGDQQKIRKMLGMASPAGQASVHENMPQAALAQPVGEVAVSAGKDPGAQLLDLIRKDLMKMVIRTLGIKAEVFAPDVDMIEYGLDSFSLAKFFSDINERYSIDLTPAVFFEYPTFNALSQYLSEEHRDSLSVYFKEDLQKAQPRTVATAPVLTEQPAAPAPLQSRFAALAGVEPLADPSARPSANPVIAVVGMSGVMPQSDNLEEFWDNLAAEKDLITEIPADRWDWRAFQGNPGEDKNKTNSKWGGFLREVDKFDPFFFGISPLEAELMDPQQRIFLETVWKTIEDAGHSAAELAGTRTALFVGVGGHDYSDVMRDNSVAVTGYVSTGNAHSVLANRISYLFDLRGTSEPVDTACSSSLVSIHRAVEAICSGSCDMAIAGGINVLLSPVLYLAFGNAGMLSSDGKCKTFDKRANGYVRGEGSGAVFLKTLEQALADGNHIYGLIRATGVNHGGHATSLTAPNPNAQADLLIEAYEKAQIDPNTVTYIEAHGTGTPLGDPVEINGLKKAFKELSKRLGEAPLQQTYCGIGSIKTNIGHLETAAGIAGFLKVLLAMKHRKIPGNIHFEELNPHIRLEGSPFYIVERTRDWEPLQDADGRTIPRRAGISSFGFGGANAHVVLEEYVPAAENTRNPAPVTDPDGNLIIPLSARTPEQLKQKAADLLGFIRMRQRQADAIDLVSMAYTLQAGRKAMDERLGCMAGSVDQLAAKLQAYVDGVQEIEGFFQGQVRHNKEGMSLISQDDEMKETIIEKCIAGGKMSKLLDLWVKGLELDWHRFYGKIKPVRMSLPAYPFARERYWVEAGGGAQAARPEAAAAVLHPLLHTNTSNFSQHSYSSVFSGWEFFLADHEVNGQKTLPAMACLEMARAAVEQAMPPAGEGAVLELHGVEWTQPFVAAVAGKTVSIALVEDEDGQIEFEIYSAEPGREIIHCKGNVLYADEVPAAVRFDIRQLKAQMEQPLDPAVLHRLLAHAGALRGPSLQGIAAVHQGDRQQLVHLKLPTAMENSRQDFVLHPSLLDSALQAAAALIADPNRTPVRPPLAPVALDSLRIFAPCAGEMYAWVRNARGSRAEDQTLRLDIDLMDAQGAVCVSFKSLAFDNEGDHEAARSDFELLLDSIGHTGARVPQPEEAEDYTKVFDKLLQDIKA